MSSRRVSTAGRVLMTSTATRVYVRPGSAAGTARLMWMTVLSGRVINVATVLTASTASRVTVSLDLPV